MIRILVVDDDRLVRSGLRVLLEGEPGLEVVAEAGDGDEAARATLEHDPDVVLMDVRMPGMGGIEATQRLAARNPVRPKVVVLTTFEHDDFVFEALRAGAGGFLLKRAEPEELVRAVRLAVSGESLVVPALTRRLIERHGRPRPDDPRRAAIGELTDREREVMRLVAAGLSNAQIAERLTVGHETVKSHVAAVLLKLGVHDRTQAVIAAYETGFVVPGGASG